MSRGFTGSSANPVQAVIVWAPQSVYCIFSGVTVCERVLRVVAQPEDPDAFPTVPVVMGGSRRAAVRIRHRPVHGDEHQIGNAVPVPIPDDRKKILFNGYVDRLPPATPSA